VLITKIIINTGRAALGRNYDFNTGRETLGLNLMLMLGRLF
jgi:hypothetical protein